MTIFLHDPRFSEIMLLHVEESRIFREIILERIIQMSDNFARLQADVSNLVSTTSKTLADIQAKLNSMANGTSDTDIGAVADQVETVVNQLNAFDAAMQGTDTTTGASGSDTTAGASA